MTFVPGDFVDERSTNKERFALSLMLSVRTRGFTQYTAFSTAFFDGHPPKIRNGYDLGHDFKLCGGDK